MDGNRVNLPSPLWPDSRSLIGFPRSAFFRPLYGDCSLLRQLFSFVIYRKLPPDWKCFFPIRWTVAKVLRAFELPRPDPYFSILTDHSCVQKMTEPLLLPLRCGQDPEPMLSFFSDEGDWTTA